MLIYINSYSAPSRKVNCLITEIFGFLKFILQNNHILRFQQSQHNFWNLLTVFVAAYKISSPSRKRKKSYKRVRELKSHHYHKQVVQVLTPVSRQILISLCFQLQSHEQQNYLLQQSNHLMILLFRKGNFIIIYLIFKVI